VDSKPLIYVADTQEFTLSRPLWLASGSRYRRELLARLRLPFAVHSPEIDETPLPAEPPATLARRLALAKARAVAALHPAALVLGSDQVCALGDAPLGKPGDAAAQIAQLERLSGQTVIFHTAVALVGLQAGLWQQHLDATRCVFRRLSSRDIEEYVAAEPAYDCAGGFKCEGLGISLLERMESLDPTAIIGLPMIWVADALRAHRSPAPTPAATVR
jgi:septum formation protein